MKNKPNFGLILFFILSFLPLIPWYFLRPNPGNSLQYSNLTHAIGQVTGIVGMTMFALTFILSTRVRFIEDLFGGLDKAYIAHSILGGMALVFILFHPLFLVLKFVPQDFKRAALYLLPSSHLSINLGIAAFILLIALVYISFYSKLKYQRWKISHEFLGITFIFAVFHIFLVRNTIARDSIFEGYFVYATIVSIIGFAGLFYSWIIRRFAQKRFDYSVKSIKQHGDGIFEIVLLPKSTPINYRSGKFIFIRFLKTNLPKEPHPFSIASKSNNPEIRVAIKSLGDFTGKLGSLKTGDRVEVEGPYGRFNFHDQNSGQIWIAGGIGITPFIGMAEDLIERKGMKNRIELYYCVKDKKEFVYFEEFKDIEKSSKGRFKFIPWVTADKGRLSLQQIQKESGDLMRREFYLCGPKGLKDTLTSGFIELGVPKSKIFGEEFNFR